MRRTRFWVLFTGVALVLLLGGGLFLALTSSGVASVHAQESTPVPTATEGGGIRTMLTATATSTSAVTGTATPLTSSAITGTGILTVTPHIPRVVTGTVPAGVTRSITVVGEGRVNVQPDTAQTTVGVEVVTDTVKAGTTAVSQTMSSLIDALLGQGIALKDIQTSGYNISLERNPIQPGQTGVQEQIRYHVSNNVTVTIRDLSKVASVLDAAINAGANNIYGINFTLSNQATVDREAYGKAMDDADARGEYLARLSGVVLGPVISVSEVISQGPVAGIFTRQAFGLGGGGGGIQPGELEVVRQLQVVYSIQ